MSVFVNIYIYTYIYIYRERERERCSVIWSFGKTNFRYGKTNIKKKHFAKRSQQNLTSTRKFCFCAKRNKKLFFYD